MVHYTNTKISGIVWFQVLADYIRVWALGINHHKGTLFSRKKAKQVQLPQSTL
jgi:hypothetical protein